MGRIADDNEGVFIRDILRAAFKTGSGSAISMALNVIASKIMAVIIGPAGIGLYSMLSQVNQSASLFGTAGGSNALIQGTASRQGQPRDDYIVTSFWIFITAGLITSIAVVGLAPWLARLVLGEADEANVWLIRYLAIPIFLSVISSFLSGILNGFRAIGRLVATQISAAVVNAVLAYPISRLVHIGYPTALIALLSLSYAAIIATCLLFARRRGWLTPIRSRGFQPFFERDSARHFFHMATITMTTAVFASVVLLVVRSQIVNHSGLSGAGIFNVAWIFGFTYATLVLGSFGTYYFPTLSLTHDRQMRADLMLRMFRVSTLMIVPLLVLAIILKPIVIQLFYSSAFLDSLRTLRWMLVGDYLKTASWVMSMPMIAYADMRTYLWTEVSWWSGFLMLSAISVQGYGDMQGVGLAYMALYLAYFIYVFHYARSRHGFILTRRSAASWCVGLILVVLSSWQTWDADTVDWPMIVPWILVIVAFFWISLLPDERKKVGMRLCLK